MLYFLSFKDFQFINQSVIIALLIFLKTFGLLCLFSVFQVDLFTWQIQQFFFLLQVLLTYLIHSVYFIPHLLISNLQSIIYVFLSLQVLFVILSQDFPILVF